MDDLDGLWKRLSLNDKEDNIFDLSSDTQPDKPTLAAKFYTRRVINVEAIARTFKPLWQTRKGFSIQDVGDNMALIEFEDVADMERVLLEEPWSYDKYLIAFHRLNNEVAVENIPLHQVDFWVQLHNLPVLNMKRKVVVAMSSYIGEVLPSPTQDEKAGNGKYLRIRVRVNITKPLCQGRKISLGNGTESWVSFQYERLPNFCYWCGIPTHGERDCEDWLRTPENLRERPLEFGSWLRANGERLSRKVQVIVEGNSRRATGGRWNSAAHTKSISPPPQPLATNPPCADFPATDMEITENLVPDQTKADFTGANPMSFEDRLHEIDVEINYAPPH
uniref:CCHC-type domain-containing protein n=1 Tax=Fagus sylvatica TaxID=28930 RepID=A0A2N9I474_FAGSY